ncbi:MAG: FtsX-like permease family protein [Bacteroidota bacterium]
MNLLLLSIKNVLAKPLSSLLSIILFGFGVSIIVSIFLVGSFLKSEITRNAQGIDLVVGAKGSPLQIILANIFHIDFPTGNISLNDANELSKNRLIASAIPLSLGDSHKGYRIIGTTLEYPELYNAELASGAWFEKNMAAAVGSKVAEALGIELGDQLTSAHGLSEGGEGHEEAPFTVVGLMKSTGTVLDQLILVSTGSVWEVHSSHGDEEHGSHDETEEDAHGVHDAHEEDEHDHDHDDQHNHDGHDHHDHHDHEEHDHHDHDKEVNLDRLGLTVTEEQLENESITSLLVKYRSPMAAVQLPRIVNATSNLQAAAPAYETARLFNIIGTGVDVVNILGVVIIVLSAISVFIALFNSLKERKYELAIMRSMGATRVKVFMLILFEGMLLTLFGSLLGFTLAHFGFSLLGNASEQIDTTFLYFVSEEVKVLTGSLLVGFLSSILPALMAYRTDISETLAKA